MTPDRDRWQIVRRHLAHLLTLEAPARRAYLDGLRDTSLRDELAELLAQQGPTEVSEPSTDVAAALPALIAGRYRVERLLGRGGMGEVYLAFDVQLKRRVAVKRVRLDRRAHEESLHRLLREAEASAPLVHPHIATVYDLLAIGEEAFLVEEYVDGVSLDQFLVNHKLTVDEVLTFTRQLLSAMSYAHAAGVVHCDLKPANLMVTGSRTLKVLDFGIAVVTSRAGSTDTGSTTRHVMCTPRYAPPEVLQGHTPSPAADVYAIGRILHDCLAHIERPAHGKVERVLHGLACEASAHHVGDRPRDASELIRKLDAALAARRWPGSLRPPEQTAGWLGWLRGPVRSLSVLRLAVLVLASVGLVITLARVVPRDRVVAPSADNGSEAPPVTPAIDTRALMSIAERAYVTGDVDQALTTAALVLAAEPGHDDALQLMQRARRAAAESATTARADADRAGAQGTDSYQQAVLAMQRAQDLDAPADIKASVSAFDDARSLFSSATATRTSTADDFLRLARAARNTNTSIQYALDGLRVDPVHPGLLRYVSSVRQAAAQRARQARDDADRAGATNLPHFGEGDRLMLQAAAVRAPRDITRAVALYAAAQQEFLAAIEAGRTAQAQSSERERTAAAALEGAREHIRSGNLDAADAQVGSVLALDPRNPTGLELRDGIRQAREERERIERERAAISAYLKRSEAETDFSQRLGILAEGLTRHPGNRELQEAAERARVSLRTLQASDGPRESEDAREILAAFDRWLSAMNRLDAADVARAYPPVGVNIAAAFNQLKSQRLEVLSRGEPVLEGATATLDCRIRYIVETKAGGNRLDHARSHRIRLSRLDGRWVITAIE